MCNQPYQLEVNQTCNHYSTTSDHWIAMVAAVASHTGQPGPRGLLARSPPAACFSSRGSQVAGRPVAGLAEASQPASQPTSLPRTGWQLAASSQPARSIILLFLCCLFCFSSFRRLWSVAGWLVTLPCFAQNCVTCKQLTREVSS